MSSQRPSLPVRLPKVKAEGAPDSPAKSKKPRAVKVASYTRAYKHSLAGLNWSKTEVVLDLFNAYTALAADLRAQQLKRFFLLGKLDRNAVIEPGKSKIQLSARYEQTCQYQVVAMLDSWLALRQEDFKQLVWRSTLDVAMKKELLSINFHKSWFKPGTRFDAEALRLAQNIMRHLFKVHRLPDVKSINLALDEKVAKLQAAEPGSHFPYWLKLSTREAGNPIYLPVSGNALYSGAGGKRNAFVQLNLSADTGLSVALLKEFEQKAYTPKCAQVSIDCGLCVFFATGEGDLLGNSIYGRLKKLDAQVQSCAAGRQRRGLRVRSPKYDALIAKVRGLLECEIGRIFNRLIKRVAPTEIVLESLDFRDVKLSRRMNRLLRNFGAGVVKDKLTALSEEYGIVVTFVPAAYSSQECPHCHHAQKENRKSRDLFSCKKCGFTRHADIVGARNVGTRRSWPEVKANAVCYLRREAVLSRLRSTHYRWCVQQSKVRKKGSLRAPESGIESSA